MSQGDILNGTLLCDLAKTYKDIPNNELKTIKEDYFTFKEEQLIGERPMLHLKLNDVGQSVCQFESKVCKVHWSCRLLTSHDDFNSSKDSTLGRESKSCVLSHGAIPIFPWSQLF